MKLYIVMWRAKKGGDGDWKNDGNAIFTERRLADNYVECRMTMDKTWAYGIVVADAPTPVEAPQEAVTA